MLNSEYEVESLSEIRIHYSKNKIAISMLFSIAVLGLSTFILTTNNIFIGLLGYCWSLYLLFNQVKRMLDKSVQIIISLNGIETKEYGFISWKDISNEQIITRRSYKSSATYLEFDDTYGTTIQTISDELDISKNNLQNLLISYRDLYENN